MCESAPILHSSDFSLSRCAILRYNGSRPQSSWKADTVITPQAGRTRTGLIPELWWKAVWLSVTTAINGVDVKTEGRVLTTETGNMGGLQQL